MSNKIAVAVIIIIKKDNKYLLTFRDEDDRAAGGSQYNRKWNFPGGGLEFGETPEQTAIREAKEELGLDIISLRLLPKIFTAVRKNWQGIFLCYSCELKNPQQKIILDQETSDYGWFTLEEIKKLKTLYLTNDFASLANRQKLTAKRYSCAGERT